jgi:hypothetical protein
LGEDMFEGAIGGFLGGKTPGRKNTVRLLFTAAAVNIAAIALVPQESHAGEGGVSFWVPGQFGSMAAVPGQPGWSFGAFDYYANVSAGTNVALAREIEIGAISATVKATLAASLKASADLVFVSPTYVFATPVLGGQFSLGMGTGYGRSNADVDGTLTITSPVPAVITRNISDGRYGFSDFYPMAQLKWNDGVNNYMIFGTADIPVGAYNSANLANVGIGHGAMDAGAGYTYFDEKTGREFSVVAGFTYNLENPSTNYQNGVDFHIDWGASQFLSKQFSVGAVGYFYDEVGCDSGGRLGCFQSRVAGIGPQASYLFPVGDKQGYLNLKAYWEFAAQNRAEGYNVWLTFAISPAAPAASLK